MIKWANSAVFLGPLNSFSHCAVADKCPSNVLILLALCAEVLSAARSLLFFPHPYSCFVCEDWAEFEFRNKAIGMSLLGAWRFKSRCYPNKSSWQAVKLCAKRKGMSGRVEESFLANLLQTKYINHGLFVQREGWCPPYLLPTLPLGPPESLNTFCSKVRTRGSKD